MVMNSSGLIRIDRIVLVSIRLWFCFGISLRLMFRLMRMKENLLICVRLVVIISVVLFGWLKVWMIR